MLLFWYAVLKGGGGGFHVVIRDINEEVQMIETYVDTQAELGVHTGRNWVTNGGTVLALLAVN